MPATPPSVQFDPAHRLWLLRTPGSAYAVRLDGEDVPRHVYWGPPLTLAQAGSVPDRLRPADSSFESPAGEGGELVTDGFGPQSLLPVFPDGTSKAEWRFAGHVISDDGLVLHLRDRRHPLEVELHYRLHEGSDVIERRLTLRHTGQEGEDPLVLARADSAAWTAPLRAGYRLSHITGAWAGEFQLERVALPIGETVLTSRRGLSSHQAHPWLMIDDGTATEEHGDVWSTALAWSGSWRVTVDHSPTGRLTWTGGFGHEGLSWRLPAGQSRQTPPFLGLYQAGGFGSTSRAWHDHIARHVLPDPDTVRPVVYNSWEATGWAVTETNQKDLAARAAAVGAELFVMDDGWFGARDSDDAGLGDWHVNPIAFPSGLTPLIDEVHRLGMRFGLWVEPEMVNPDSDLYRAHPDWVLHMPHRARTTLRNQLVLNFARPDVVSWAHEWLDALLRDHAIDYLKWDMNRAFTEAGWPDAGPDATRLWFDHVHGVHSVIDRLREDHPHLRVQTCAGGGGRADLGMLARTDEAWVSDNTDAVDRIAIQDGYSQLYPARTMAAWVTDSPNYLTRRALPLRFRFHVAMAGVLGIGGNLLEWSAAELVEATELVTLYKEIRGTVQHGVQYRLGTHAGRTAVQYVSRDGAQTVVLGWQQPRRAAGPVLPVRLLGLDPAAVYRDDDSGGLHHGAVLLQHGLSLDLTTDHASTLIRLSRIP
ncbi:MULTISPECIES: alpha-galactosidase [Streptosporangium]|uniref:Alpha-galactosidase n=1 Tax=Streptosporangium brasiliense TaxID=47480 RepID=A0ABT9RDW5_9ACTN|nr:alpha-galactosidase [Streptosporangium brasiliense]MDP9867446.1 alpha-galactosidase [Streptosporangium brasiliense]